MLSKNILRSIAEIEKIVGTADRETIGAFCFDLVKRRWPVGGHNFSLDECRIFAHLVAIKHEPLNDRLSLNPYIFAATQNI